MRRTTPQIDRLALRAVLHRTATKLANPVNFTAYGFKSMLHDLDGAVSLKVVRTSPRVLREAFARAFAGLREIAPQLLANPIHASAHNQRRGLINRIQQALEDSSE